MTRNEATPAPVQVNEYGCSVVLVKQNFATYRAEISRHCLALSCSFLVMAL